MLRCSFHQPNHGRESSLSLSNELNANFFGVQWDRDNPSNTSRWQTQHNGLRDLRPPYVYNVFNHDTEGFVKAVKDALANPIDR